MSNFEIPPGFSVPFTSAVNDFRMGKRDEQTLRELRTRFGTEHYYIEAIEEIYSENSWHLEPKIKKIFRKIFRKEAI